MRIDALQLDDAVSQLLLSRHGQARSVHLCNAYTLSLAARDDSFRQVLNQGDLNLPDGTPVAWVGRRHGHRHMRGRVYGPDLFERTIEQGREQGLRHHLYGSTPQVVENLKAALVRRYGVHVVGAESPPFRDLTDEEVADLRERVADAGADIVWLGLGTPKQDLFAERMKGELGATLVAVGAAFDFMAGTKKQAPRWVQQRGLEWLYRLATEPRRLWRRYLIGNSVFLCSVLRSLVAGDDADGPSGRRR